MADGARQSGTGRVAFDPSGNATPPALSTIRRFARLTREERALVITAALLQVGAHLLLRVWDLRRVDRLAVWLGGRRARTASGELLAWALQASAPRVGGTCLTQALAARVLLGWSRQPSALVIGARAGHEALEFHAWTESARMVLPGADRGPSFTRLVTWS
jgi:hypothetical protein